MSVNKSVSQSVNQAINQSINQSVYLFLRNESHSIIMSVIKSVSLSVNQAINQSINHQSIIFYGINLNLSLHHFYIYSVLKDLKDIPKWTAALNLVACVGRVSAGLGGLCSIE